MNTKIKLYKKQSTVGKTIMNVLSRMSTFTTKLLAIFALLITMFVSTVQAENDEIVFFHVNAIGSATAAFNEAGDLCWKQQYTPYGEQTNNDDASPPAGCGLIGKDRGYTGHTQDESGLTYMQQRYYDPTIGRFLSVDPVGVIAKNTKTYNRYMYGNNNPYKFVDPTGMYVESPLEALSIAIGLTSLSYNVANRNVLASIVDIGGLTIDVIGAALPGVPGVASAGISFARGATTKEVSYLYRGVHAGHPAIDAARRGEVVPGNINGSVTPEKHNSGGHAADSPFTSWTRNQSTAADNAAKNGNGGIILRVPTGAPPSGSRWNWEMSPDIYREQEVLMRGIRSGVEVMD